MDNIRDKKELKIIGAGWARTGTTTLKKVLEDLGYKHTYHMKDLIANAMKHVPLWRKITSLPFPSNVDDFVLNYSNYIYNHGNDTEETKNMRHKLLKDVFEGYDAAVDMPTSVYFEDLIEIYPNSKVILSIRDFESWYRSSSNTVLHLHPNSNQASFGLKLFYHLSPIGIGLKSFSNFYSVIPITKGEEEIKIAYDAWIDYVKRIVPKDKLLIVKVGEDGWKPFCDFLEIKQCPNSPFPHINEKEEMMKRFKRAENYGYFSLATLIAFAFMVIFIISRCFKRNKKPNHDKRE